MAYSARHTGVGRAPSSKPACEPCLLQFEAVPRSFYSHLLVPPWWFFVRKEQISPWWTREIPEKRQLQVLLKTQLKTPWVSSFKLRLDKASINYDLGAKPILSNVQESTVTGVGMGNLPRPAVFLQKILIVRTVQNYKLLSAKQYIYIVCFLSNLIKKISGKPEKGGLRASLNPREDPHCKEINDSLAPVARISVQVISRGLFARCGTLRFRV